MQQSSIPTSAPIIDLVTLRSRQQRGSPLVLVEALPEKYFASGHLPGAVHLPHDQADAAVRAALPDRDASIITYCASATCPNSHVLAARLLRLGYRDVTVFADGKAGWLDAGLPLES